MVVGDSPVSMHVLCVFQMDRAEKLLQQAFAARQELLPVHFGFLVGEYHKQGLWAKVREWMDMALESKQVMEVMDFNAAIHACCKLDDVEGMARKGWGQILYHLAAAAHFVAYGACMGKVDEAFGEFSRCSCQHGHKARGVSGVQHSATKHR